jgi:hypothetical protein
MTAGAAPWLQPPQFHYRLGVRMRQHVRGGSGSAPRSLNPLAFWSWVVTSGLPQSQEYKQRKLYSFVKRLLQICANVKSTSLRRGWRGGAYGCSREPHNSFIFNALQGYSFSILPEVEQNSRANLREGAAVSTTFSTEERVSNWEEKELQEEPQVRKNRGFARFYSTVSRSKARTPLRRRADHEGAVQGA